MWLSVCIAERPQWRNDAKLPLFPSCPAPHGPLAGEPRPSTEQCALAAPALRSLATDAASFPAPTTPPIGAAAASRQRAPPPLSPPLSHPTLTRRRRRRRRRPVPDPCARPPAPGCAHEAPAADALRYGPLQTQGQRSDHDTTHRARLCARAGRLRDAPPRPHQQGRAG
jgi:hypothetical protein